MPELTVITAIEHDLSHEDIPVDETNDAEIGSPQSRLFLFLFIYFLVIFW